MQKFLARLKFLLGWNRIAISLAGSVALLIFAYPTPLSLMVGSLIALSGAILRTWASGYVKKNRELSMDGPYAYVRHPLYVGNFLLGFGFSVMAGRWFLIIAFGLLFYALYSSVIHEEEKILQKTFGESYTEYSNKVPAFIPSFSRRGPQTGHFTWKLVKQHREYQAWLGILGGIGLLTIKMIWLKNMAG